MSLLKEIQKWLNGEGHFPELFGPAAFGGLLGLFLSRGRGLGGGVLLAGGGAALAVYLWKKYKNSLKENKVKPPRREPIAALPPGTPSPEALRLVRALVFAARSDGHIDPAEEASIRKNLAEMKLGEDTEALLARVMQEPLEPGLVAEGLVSPEEALQLYLLSCTVVDIEPGPQEEYLKNLAQALGIPEDMRLDIADDLRRERME